MNRAWPPNGTSCSLKEIRRETEGIAEKYREKGQVIRTVPCLRLRQTSRCERARDERRQQSTCERCVADRCSRLAIARHLKTGVSCSQPAHSGSDHSTQ